MLAVLTIAITTVFLLVRNDYEAEVTYNNQTNDIRTELTETEFKEYFGDSEVEVLIILEYDSKFTDEELRKTPGFADDLSENDKTRLFHTYNNTLILNQLRVDEEDVVMSNYTPFIFIKVTDFSYDELMDLLEDIKIDKHVSSIEVKTKTSFSG